MTIYNTSADAANTAIRAFLTRVGEYYLNRSFNTGSGKAKDDWNRIKVDVFQGKCAYCGEECESPQMEHLIMFNRVEYGLHHPGNVVPTCKSCNKRFKKPDNTYVTWEEQLEKICHLKSQPDKVPERKGKILVHIKTEGYPNLSREEKHAIRVIAESLYKNIQMESDKSMDLYRQIHKAFVWS
ncbi:HNH endonuclease [Chloroflexota bacterium]